MPQILIGFLTAHEKPARNMLLIRRDGEKLEMRFVFCSRQALEFLDGCVKTTTAAYLHAQALLMLARSDLPADASTPPVILNGLPAGTLWADLADALAKGKRNFTAMATVMKGMPGINSSWIPTHEGSTEGFVSHTDVAERNWLTVVHSREQARELLRRYRLIEKHDFLETIRKRIEECVLPETSDRPAADVEGGVADLIRTVLMLMRLPSQAN